MTPAKWTALIIDTALLLLAVFLFYRINKKMRAELGQDAPSASMLALILLWTSLLMALATSALDQWHNPVATIMMVLLVLGIPYCLFTAIRFRKHTDQSRYHKGIFVGVVYFPMAIAILFGMVALATYLLADSPAIPQ